MNIIKKIFSEFLIFLDLSDENNICIVCANEIDESNDGISILERIFVHRERIICTKCIDSMKVIDGTTCIKCGRYIDWNINDEVFSDKYNKGLCSDCEKSSKYYSYVMSCFEYNGQVKEIMHRFKYAKENSIANIFGYYMAKKFEKEFIRVNREKLNNLLLVPVPLSPEKMETRGYNQAELLAMKVSEITGFEVACILTRNRNTLTQYSLGKDKRSRNIEGAFSVDIGYNILNEHIILIDDIFTTGSTANECAKILGIAGAKSITVLTAAGGGMKDKGIK